jgi:hypothetical protein
LTLLRWLLARLLFWRKKRPDDAALARSLYGETPASRAERRRLRRRAARYNRKVHAKLMRLRSHGGPSHTKAVHNDRKRAKT